MTLSARCLFAPSLLALSLPLAAPSAPAGAEPLRFDDRALELGVRFEHESGARGAYFMPEIFGAGAALFDYDGDGDLDLFAVDSGIHGRVTSGASAELGGSPSGGGDRLWRQEADGRFVEVSAESGLGGGFDEEGAGYGTGVAVGDVDGDGLDDLLVTHFGAGSGLALYRNLGDGTFADITAESGLASSRSGEGEPGEETWATSGLFADSDGDGDLDLFVVHYLRYEPPLACSDQAGRPDYCGPGAFAPTADRLYRNKGGRFTDVSAASGLEAWPGKGLAAAASDFDGDGRLDFYVANDGEPNRLWLQESPGRFTDRAVERGAAVNALGRPEAGMGVAVGDVDGDGLDDVVVSHLRGETHTLYAADPDLGFLDRTAASGLGGSSLALTGFGVVFADFDLDADLDVAVANGGVTREPSPAAGVVDPFAADYAQPASVWLGDGGRFVPVEAGELTAGAVVGRALVRGDLDDDGDVDLVLSTAGGQLRIFDNRLEAPRRWLQVAVRGASRSGFAEQARVRVVEGGAAQTRRVDRGQSYLSSHDPRCHFGLGEPPPGEAEDRVDRLEVTWPGGESRRFLDVPANRRLVVVP